MDDIYSVTVEVEDDEGDNPYVKKDDEGDNSYVKLDFTELMKVAEESSNDSKLSPDNGKDYVEKTQNIQLVIKQQVYMCIVKSEICS